jgi:hypothetical protein
VHALPALAAHRAAIYSLPPGPSAFKWSPQPSSSASLPIFASVSEGRVVLLSFSSGSEWTESEAWIAALAHQCCAFFGGLVRTRCSEDGNKNGCTFRCGQREEWCLEDHVAGSCQRSSARSWFVQPQSIVTTNWSPVPGPTRNSKLHNQRTRARRPG